MNRKSLQKVWFLAQVVLGVLVVFWIAQAGNLDPPAAPASSMVTLQEVYDRVSASPVGIARTGQTDCWDVAGNPMVCAGTGQDGEFQAGVAISPRFTDNGNGTVKDNLTGLVWLKDANCFGSRTWANALLDANTLADGLCGLTDGSVAGAWRLPNIKELQSLIDFGQNSPALPAGHPFTIEFDAYHWSSTSYHQGQRYDAWYMHFYNGWIYAGGKTSTQYVWPVRSGQ